MNSEQLTKVQNKLKKAIDPRTINAIGMEVGFSKRLRKVRPDGLVVAVITALAVQKVETLADLPRSFCAVTGCSVEHKPFHNQLAKQAFPEFMRRVLCQLLEHAVLWALNGLDRGCNKSTRRSGSVGFAVKLLHRSHKDVGR